MSAPSIWIAAHTDVSILWEVTSAHARRDGRSELMDSDAVTKDMNLTMDSVKVRGLHNYDTFIGTKWIISFCFILFFTPLYCLSKMGLYSVDILYIEILTNHEQ